METIQESKINKPLIKVLATENTHLASGGSVIPYEHNKAISEINNSNGLKLQNQGARI